MSKTSNDIMAFPLQGRQFPGGESIPSQYGMTLRDYFAAMALGNERICDADQADYAEANARMAYKVADAMLAERGKTP